MDPPFRRRMNGDEAEIHQTPDFGIESDCHFTSLASCLDLGFTRLWWLHMRHQVWWHGYSLIKRERRAGARTPQYRSSASTILSGSNMLGQRPLIGGSCQDFRAKKILVNVTGWKRKGEWGRGVEKPPPHTHDLAVANCACFFRSYKTRSEDGVKLREPATSTVSCARSFPSLVWARGENMSQARKSPYHVLETVAGSWRDHPPGWMVPTCSATSRKMHPPLRPRLPGRRGTIPTLSPLPNRSRFASYSEPGAVRRSRAGADGRLQGTGVLKSSAA